MTTRTLDGRPRPLALGLAHPRLYRSRWALAAHHSMRAALELQHRAWDAVLRAVQDCTLASWGELATAAAARTHGADSSDLAARAARYRDRWATVEVHRDELGD